MELSREQLTHSEVLFTKENGGPLNFYMRPCKERVDLRRLIEHGGGEISSRLLPDSIRLYLSTDICFSDECYDSKYIRDCIKEGYLLDLEDYKIKNSKESEKRNTHLIRKRKKVRHPYTVEEDNDVLMYVAEHQTMPLRGNVIWKKMEDAKVTIHTWQSMKDRYFKKLKDRLPEFKEIVKNQRLARRSSSSEDKESIVMEAEENEEPSPQTMQVEADTDTENEGTWIHVCQKRQRIRLNSHESDTESGNGKPEVETQTKTSQQVETQTSTIPTENIEQEIETQIEMDLVDEENMDKQSSDEDVAQIVKDMQRIMKKYGLTFEQCAYVYYINNTNTKKVAEWFKDVIGIERV